MNANHIYQVVETTDADHGEDCHHVGYFTSRRKADIALCGLDGEGLHWLDHDWPDNGGDTRTYEIRLHYAGHIHYRRDTNASHGQIVRRVTFQRVERETPPGPRARQHLAPGETAARRYWIRDADDAQPPPTGTNRQEPINEHHN